MLSLIRGKNASPIIIPLFLALTLYSDRVCVCVCDVYLAGPHIYPTRARRRAISVNTAASPLLAAFEIAKDLNTNSRGRDALIR